jgi:hypothetical protein
MSRVPTQWVSSPHGDTLDGMPATAETPREPPSAKLMEAMRRHHQDEHGLSFDLDRDVYFRGNTPAGTTYDIASDPVGGERYWCAICGPGRVFFPKGLPYGTPERNAFLQQTSPHLQALLAGTPFEEHDALTEVFDRQELGRLRPPERSAKPDARRRGTAASVRHTPAYQRRLEGFRPWFLDAYAATGSIERAIEMIVALHKSDLDAYSEILGTSRLLNEETFRQYVYRATSQDERARAKSRWDTAQDERRSAPRASG